MNQTSDMPASLTGRILVVGATGFLGAKILAHLEKSGHAPLRAMSRRSVSPETTGNTQWVKADLMDPASLDHALADIDVVVTSANGYMKETIDADYEGNKNLIKAAARTGVKRFVFLSVVACDAASYVPHFHAKKVAEDLIISSGLAYVFVRAPAFLDQSADYIADGVMAGRFYAVGDTTTRWSYILSDDLAETVAKAALYPTDDIHNQTIDAGWGDGPRSQAEVADLIMQVTGRRLKIWTIPWVIFQLVVRPVGWFSALGYDLIQMFLFFRTGRFVSDLSQYNRFFGTAPSAKDAIARWASERKLI
jgi:uncharacterized protein YbjT (DUF2867 family)